MTDERQLVPREPEPRRVTATPDDVIGPGEQATPEQTTITVNTHSYAFYRGHRTLPDLTD